MLRNIAHREVGPLLFIDWTCIHLIERVFEISVVARSYPQKVSLYPFKPGWYLLILLILIFSDQI